MQFEVCNFGFNKICHCKIIRKNCCSKLFSHTRYKSKLIPKIVESHCCLSANFELQIKVIIEENIYGHLHAVIIKSTHCLQLDSWLIFGTDVCNYVREGMKNFRTTRESLPPQNFSCLPSWKCLVTPLALIHVLYSKYSEINSLIK